MLLPTLLFAWLLPLGRFRTCYCLIPPEIRLILGTEGVVVLFCVDVFSPQLALVSPWMVNGDVVTYVKKYPSVNRSTLVCGQSFRAGQHVETTST